MVRCPAAGRPAPVRVAVRRLGAAVPLRSQRVVPLSHHCGGGEDGEWRPDRRGANKLRGRSARTRPISGRCWSPENRSVALPSPASCFQLCGGRGGPASRPWHHKPITGQEGDHVVPRRCVHGRWGAAEKQDPKQNWFVAPSREPRGRFTHIFTFCKNKIK